MGSQLLSQIQYKAMSWKSLPYLPVSVRVRDVISPVFSVELGFDWREDVAIVRQKYKTIDRLYWLRAGQAVFLWYKGLS